MNLPRKIWRYLRGTGLRRNFKLILDRECAVGNVSARCGYKTDLDKEAISRKYVLEYSSRFSGQRLRFLDVGGRDGKLSYLLGNVGPLQFDLATYERFAREFHALYDYFGVDLRPAGPNVLVGDVCDDQFAASHPDAIGTFDVVYSNNVFEHFERPWIAAQTIVTLMKRGAICITVVPFAQRYHEDPGDYFRYTPAGIIKLFEAAETMRVLEAGFDIRARRYDWQGGGDANDIVPQDRFGAWRETWYTLVILQKT
jgi:SAM-dependent methyltransferase